MSKVTDLHILAHARTFRLGVWLPKPETGGGVVIGGDTVSEARIYEAAKRLLERGLLTRRDERTGRGDSDPRHTLARFEITDAGRAAVREFEGRDELTVNAARELHDRDLVDIYGDLPIARRQLELRQQGRDLLRAALKGLGYEFTGSAGWSTLAFVTPSGTLGFVNICEGIAVETTVPVPDDVAEALTVPSQKTGPQVSGAAAWTSPDAGEPQSSSAPEGWVQLGTDLRGGSDIDIAPFEAWVVAWGLCTCYDSRRGEPGNTYLFPPANWPQKPKGWISPREWPMSPEQRGRVVEIAERQLSQIAAGIAGLESEDVARAVSDALAAPFSGEPPALASRGADAPQFPTRDTRAAHDAMSPLRPPRGDTYLSGREALLSIATPYAPSHDVVWGALRSARIATLALFESSNVAGTRVLDVIADALSLALYRRLERLATETWDVFVSAGRGDVGTLVGDVRAALAPIASALASEILAPFAKQANAAYSEIVSAYYADGHIQIPPGLIECQRAKAAA